MNNWYVLDKDRNPVLTDMLTGAKALSNPSRVVAQTDLDGGVTVSTVFLGLDLGWGGDVELFETLVFEGELDGEMERYATWHEAEDGHQRMVARCQKRTEPPEGEG